MFVGRKKLGNIAGAALVLFVIGGVFASNDKVTDWDMGATAYELNFRYLALKGLLD